MPVQKGMVSDSDVMSISIDPGNPDHVFSSACSGIYHSPDGGANWTKFKGIPTTRRRTVQIKQDPQHPENRLCRDDGRIVAHARRWRQLAAHYSTELEHPFDAD